MSIDKDTHDEDVFYHNNLTLKNSNEEKILGVTIGRKLTFHQHTKKNVSLSRSKIDCLTETLSIP